MALTQTDFQKFFNPGQIAIIGVSTGEYKLGGMSFLIKLQESGFAGKLYPINPKAKQIRNLKAYPDLLSLPEVPDLAIVCVAARFVPDILEDCARIGLNHIHILTSGFKETGLEDGKLIQVGNIAIKVLFTPGHTNDSFSFIVEDDGQTYLFSGDTLLIRGTGRTDFQSGSPDELYDSLHEKLLTLPDNTLVYPGHDYKGWTVSTIGEEKHANPRLEPATKEAFTELMNNLDLPDPKMMDVAVPANRACGVRKGDL